VAAFLITSVRQLWVLLVLSALSLGYIAYEVNFIYLQRRQITIWHSGFGGLDNNGAGLMLAMGVPLCLFVWEGSRRWWRWAFAAFIPVLIHAVLMSFSRGAMVALLVACPLFIVRSRFKAYLSLAFLGVIMVLPLMAGAEIQKRFFSIEQYEKDESAQSRFRSWKAAWEIASLNPINGVGLRNSNLYTGRYGADASGRTIHSQYLQLAADSGFVGLAIYLSVFFWVWRSTRRTRRAMRYREDPEAVEAYAVANGVECALAVFCVGAAFLSLELFELPYLLALMGAQLTSVLNLQARRPAAEALIDSYYSEAVAV
jgi:probable O-glycosylation ligase (exosortase A-associated)